MKFNDLETSFAFLANVAEAAAHKTDDDAKAAAAVVRGEGNQRTRVRHGVSVRPLWV